MIAFRHRTLQALTIALLAALVTACVVFAPLYDRAMQQALTRIKLEQTSVPVRGLQLTSNGRTPQFGDPYQPPRGSASLTAVVPSRLRQRYGAPIAWHTSEATATAPTADTAGDMQWRRGQCAHLRFVQGRCPSAAGEVAVSPDDARRLGLTVGSRMPANGMSIGDFHQHTPTTTLTVTGLFRQPRDDPFWFGRVLTGQGGMVSVGPPRVISHDKWVTAAATFGDNALPVFDSETSLVDLPLAVDRVGIEQLRSVDHALAALQRDVARDPSLHDVRVYSGLPDVAADVRHQTAQSRVTVPLLMVQLALLGVVVLWLVLAAATDQRRPEVAVSMLRGRGRLGARMLLLRELLPVTLSGVPVGAGLALLLSWLARDALLPGSAPFEVLRGSWLAVAGAAVALVAVTVVVVNRVTREPVEQLLRRVPVRRAGWSVGVLEAVLVAASATAVVAFASGGLTGPIALAAPLLLALVVGLVLGHATTPVAAWLGRRLLARGRIGTGISLLDAARTPATRRAVAIVTIAAALLVFAASALVVGARNRGLAAQQVAGAPMTAPVRGNDLPGVRAALHDVDPRGHRVTAVVFNDPPAKGSQQIIAAVPPELARIALFPGRDAAPDLDGLRPPAASPIRLVGDAVSVTVTTRSLRARNNGRSATAGLQLAVVYADGAPGTVTLGDLPRSADATQPATSTLSGFLHCETPCNLTGVSVLTDPGASVTGSIQLAGLTVTNNGVPTTVPLGPASQWSHVDDRVRGTMTPTSPDGRDLFVGVRTAGARRTTMTQKWVPDAIPAIVVGRLPGRVAGPQFDTINLDSQSRHARAAGRLPRIPRAGARAALVDLDVLSRGLSTVDPRARIEVWFARDDPALYRRVAAAMARRGSILGEPLTLPEVRRRYDQSTSAWSLALGAVVGVTSLLLALLVVTVLAVTGWRPRSHDLAALRMTGLPRSTVRSVATLAQLPALVVAVVAGTVCGVVGAHLTMARVPLFASAPAVSTLDLGVPWTAAILVAALALVVLLAAGWYAGRATARRAHLQRVRETL